MAEVQHTHTNGKSDAADAKKRKGFWPNVFGRSSNKTGEHKDDQQPKGKGFMDSLMNNARQAATKEVMHVAEEEAVKEVKAQFHNNNGSQPTDANTNTTTTNVAPDASTVTTTTTPDDDALSAPTNWAKRMVDSVQQKMQGLQNLAS